VRPVNLIPPDQRRGEQATLRTGPVAYILLGALVLVLAGVTALVLTENQIADRKSEVVILKREDTAAQAQAKRLAAYSQFRALSEQRVATVTSLADSRFDWERVMRELALVLPSDVWLSGLEATATPSVSLGGGEGGVSSSANLRGAIPGPALQLSGCATGQDAVAGFVTALKEIDGVTRVGVESSELPSNSEGAGAGSGGSGDCRTRQFIAQFNLIVAFDAAPVQPEEGEAEATSATATAETASSETSTSSEESSGEGSEGG
jgi:Tfp pilus assembly protein PilN